MVRSKRTGVVTFLCVAWTVLLSGCNTGASPPPEKAVERKPQQTREQLVELGRQHKTAGDLYKALRDQAKGGQPLSAATLPDWAGVFTRIPVPGFAFDPDQPANGLPTAKLTRRTTARMTVARTMAARKRGLFIVQRLQENISANSRAVAAASKPARPSRSGLIPRDQGGYQLW